MASISFPSSPSNGDTYSYDGLTYQYNSTKNKWSVVATTTITDVQADSISTSLSPSANVTYDLGTSEKSFRDLYLSGSTIHLGSQQISSNSTGVILPEGSLVGTSEIGSGSGVTVYANASILPTTGLTSGEMAYTGNAIFITNGSGWYRIAVVNQDPSITLSQDSISLGATGNTVFFTYTTSDPDGTTPTVTLSNTGIANTTVANVNLYTANNTVRIDNFSATDWSGTITLTASDGISTGFDSLTVSVEYVSQYWDETALSIDTSSTNSLDNDTFIDRSGNSRGITISSGTPHQSAFHPYLDNWGVKFDGNDYLQTSNVTNSSLAGATLTRGQDKTIELFIYMPTIPTDVYGVIGASNGGGNQPKWGIFINASTGYLYQANRIMFGAGQGGAAQNYEYVWEAGRWYHIAWAWDQSTSTASMYVNGTRVGTGSAEIDASITTAVDIGSDGEQYKYFNGFISNVRIVNGTALYSGASITPPSEELAAVTNTTLLACQSNRFIDVSTNNDPITIVGNPKVVAFNPFGQGSEYATGANKGSVYFDGSGDYLDVDASTDIGTGDFTIQGWIYDERAVTNERQIISNRGDGGGLYLGLTSTSELYPYIGGSYATSGAGIQANAWQHFALCRTSGTMEIYVNGVRYRSDNQGSDFFGSTGWLIGGGDVGQFKGWIADLRVATVADYTGASYTIPTSPTGSTNADLYLTGDNAGIFDKTGNHTLTLGGDASTSTTQTKFATTSMYFDGTGDYARLTDMPSFGTTSFTVEGWIYNSSAGGSSRNIADARTGSSWTIQAASNEYKVYDEVTASYIHTTTGSFETNNLNSWIHIAWCRSGSTSRFFINGTQVGSDVSNSSNYQNTSLRIGSRYSEDQQYFQGYIENFQILNGVAKYTTNFTPPTQTQGRTYQASS